MKHLIFVVTICLAGGITSYGQLVPQAKISSQSKTGSKREKQGSVEASPLVENCDIHLDAITTGDTKLTGYVPQEPTRTYGTLAIVELPKLKGWYAFDDTGKFEIHVDQPDDDAPAFPAKTKIHLTYKLPSDGGAFDSNTVMVQDKPKAHTVILAKFGKGDDRVIGEVKGDQPILEIALTAKGGAIKDRVRAVVEADKHFRGAFAAGVTLACGDTIAFGDVDHYTVTCDPPAPPRPYPVKEGDKSIGGVAGDAANVTADVTVGEILIERATGAAKDGQFSVTFQNKLVTSQTIVLTGKTADSVPVPGQNITVQPIDFDWGRVRAYFVAGVLFSQNDGGSSNGNFFSRQDFFMSFNLDKNWAYRRNWRFHSFFDARLGAIPVHNDSPKPSSSTTGSGSTTGSSSTTGSGSTTGSATTTATPFSDPNSFAGSQKVGTFVAGIYAPFTATRWYYHDQPNSFFIAPLMKIGFSTPSNEALRDNASAIVVPSTNRFFTQMVGGLRFGQVREYELHCPCRPGTERDLSKAPELISYLDAGLGKFGNFLESPGPALPTDSRVYRLWRYQLEGILKIPSTPLFIGFQANVAAQHGHKDYRQPPDDLRILFGTRFDIGKLFAKLLTF